MTKIITSAAQTDIDAVKQIEVESGLSGWTINDYIAEVGRADSLFFVFKENSNVLGFILARLIMVEQKNSIENGFKNEAEIYNIAVKSQFRHRKIGSKLLDKMFKSAAEKKVRKIHLEVRKTNNEAVSFYRKNGFKITGERRNFYTNPTEDAILMCRFLSD